MKKLSRGARLQEAIDLAVECACDMEQGEDRSELHFSHPKAGTFVLQRRRMRGLRDDHAPFAFIRYVNRAIES